MIIEEFLKDGTLVKHYSDQKMMLLQVETGRKYPVPLDAVPCRYTYEETDEPIYVHKRPERLKQKDREEYEKQQEEVAAAAENASESVVELEQDCLENETPIIEEPIEFEYVEESVVDEPIEEDSEEHTEAEGEHAEE